jgi:hypothetical protein
MARSIHFLISCIIQLGADKLTLELRWLFKIVESNYTVASEDWRRVYTAKYAINVIFASSILSSILRIDSGQ